MAKQMNDIGLVEDDLQTAAGDFVVAESTLQHQRQLIANNKGDFKEQPTICVGAYSYIDDEPGYGALAREISKEYSRDNLTINSINVTQAGVIQTDAVYE